MKGWEPTRNARKKGMKQNAATCAMSVVLAAYIRQYIAAQPTPVAEFVCRGVERNRSPASGIPGHATLSSRYEIACPYFVISLRLLMPFRNFAAQVIL